MPSYKPADFFAGILTVIQQYKKTSMRTKSRLYGLLPDDITGTKEL
jgi:hypothetical protein